MLAGLAIAFIVSKVAHFPFKFDRRQCGQLHEGPKPVILVQSRPDLYDKQEGWRALVEKQRPAVVAILSEFQVYEWPAKAESGVVHLSSIDQQTALSFPGGSQ
jgi:hypothetical protein